MFEQRLLFTKFILQPIYQILKSSADGKTVLKFYEQNRFLDKKVWSLMTRLIIRHEKDRSFGHLVIGGEPDILNNFT